MFIRKLWKLFSLASHFIIYQYCFISTVTDEEGKMQIASTLFRIPIGGNSVDARQSTTFRRLYLVEKKKGKKEKRQKIVIISYPEN